MSEDSLDKKIGDLPDKEDSGNYFIYINVKLVPKDEKLFSYVIGVPRVKTDNSWVFTFDIKDAIVFEGAKEMYDFLDENKEKLLETGENNNTWDRKLFIISADTNEPCGSLDVDSL